MHTPNSLPSVAAQVPPPLAPGDAAYDQWYSELQYFQTIRHELLAQPHLRDQFVAIQNHQILATDPDKFALSHRMDALHPREVVFIAQVTPDDRIVEIPGLF